MTKYISYAWWIWAVLILGLGLSGACSDNPTTPGPSDVQGFTFEGGGDSVDKTDLTELLDEYDALVAAGGGAVTVVDPNGHSLIGCFERWTGASIRDANVIVQQAGQDPVSYDFDGMALFTNLTYPITVTVSHDRYVMQTLVETDANVIAFGMDPLWMGDSAATLMGCAYNYDDAHLPWLVRATSTHMNRNWRTTKGFPNSDPATIIQVNAGQSVGAVAFLYKGLEGVDWTPYNEFEPNLANYELCGYSYSHIGTLDRGSVGAWIMDLNETGAGNGYDPGTYTVQHTFPWVGGFEPLVHGRLTLTPGGCLDDTCEFVPYYPPVEYQIWADSGTYEIGAYDPPVMADRHVIIAEIEYADRSSERRVYSWDPSGASVPSVDFGTLPDITTSQITHNPSTLSAAWTNDAAPGMLLLTVLDEGSHPRWQIYLGGAATEIPSNGVVIPPYESGPVAGHMEVCDFGDAFIEITRIECPGINPSSYDYRTIWTGTTAELTSYYGEVEY